MVKASPLKVIAITSGKGGVGKTNVAVNLAVSLAEPGRACCCSMRTSAWPTWILPSA
jgi:Mrp family chromosome partitioning ATPase